MSVLDYKYFTVEELPLEPGRKTHVYRVLNRSSGACIGIIEWYGAWRQFCFFPSGDSVWSSGCLDDIQDVLRRLKSMRER